jgi:predicted RNA-binding protein with PUA-like domain
MSETNGANYWMVKQEPETYSWEDLVREGKTDWTGVRNFQARNNLRSMKVGDKVLFYHSGKEKAVVGVARVAKAAYRDPTAEEGDWVAVDIKAVKPLVAPVLLASIRYDDQLKNLALLRQTQLSVLPLSADEFQRIVYLGNNKRRS